MQGRIKLHRKAQSNPISTNLELRGLFTYFLTKANHAEGSFFHGQQKIDLLPGQFIRSMQGIADHFSISKPKAYRLTELLEKSEIVKRQGYSKYTLFTVVNRGLYQSEGNATVTRSETPPYTNKNDKNKQEGKEIYEQHILDFIEYRKNIKKPMTNKAIELFIDKLHKLSSNKNDQIKMVEKSIMNNWLSVFALHEKEMTISIQKIQIDYQQEVAKDKDNKKAIWDKYISEYGSDTMQQVLDKINTLSFTSSLL